MSSFPAEDGLSTGRAAWRGMRIGWIFRTITSGGTPDSRDETYYNGSIPWINTSDLNDGDIEVAERTLSDTALRTYPQLKLLDPGTLLVSMYTTGALGKTGVLRISAAVNQACCALADPVNVDVRFIQYWFIANRPRIIAMAQGGAQGNLNQNMIRNLRVALPSLVEQRAIATYLDRETARIDAMIDKKRQLLSILAERLSSYVSSIMTCGIVPVSGLQTVDLGGMGTIPITWKVVRLKFLSKILGGVTKGRDLAGKRTVELPYLRVANVQDGYLDLDDIATIEVLPDEVERYLLLVGDVLMNEGGDIDKLGRGAVWNGEIDPCLHQNHVFAIRPHPGVNSDWLATFTLTHFAKQYFETRGKQTTNLASISASNLKELPVVLPPQAQQRMILGMIEWENQHTHRLGDAIRAELSLLQERRQALITAAVTGQLDVAGISV